MKERNPYPTKRQEDALKDVLKYPADSLADRAKRFGITRAGVLGLLRAIAAKDLVEPDERGKWSVTLEGRRWLRPLMAERRAAK